MAPSLALVHDYLTQRGGAERVVATWCHGFPDAPLYTSLFEPDLTFGDFGDHEVRTSWLNHAGPFRRHHRLALPLLAPTMSHWQIDADVVLASSSGWAHGVKTDGRLLVYCHAPARWLYQGERYLRAGALGRRAQVASRALAPSLRRWDQHVAKRADRYLANSTFTRDLLRSIYNIDAEILAPPVALPPVPTDAEPTVDVLVVSRLLPYKNVDMVLDVARLMPEHSFAVVGDGPLRPSLEGAAPANVTFVGAVRDDATLASHYAHARLLLALSHEDFGITPLEAALAGRPTVARRAGGYLDTVTDATGILVDEGAVTPLTVRDALRDALARQWDVAVLRAHAASFGAERHLERLRTLISEAAPRP